MSYPPDFQLAWHTNTKYLTFPFPFLLSIIGTILLLIYSPADTEKRPLIHKKKRIIYKILTTTISTIYTILNIITKDNILSNIITFSILLEAIIVLPISYKLFGLKYNNYLNYKERRTN